MFSVNCLESFCKLLGKVKCSHIFTFHTILKPKRALSPFLSDLYVCLSVCPSVTLAALFSYTFHEKPRAPLMTTSLLYMHETVIGYKLLGTGIHLLKVKWRSLKICFWAFMDVFMCAFHGKQEHRFWSVFFSPFYNTCVRRLCTI